MKLVAVVPAYSAAIAPATPKSAPAAMGIPTTL